MFGVDASGNDTLAPQFKRGSCEKGDRHGKSFERQHGFEIIFAGNVRFLETSCFREIRERLLIALKEHGTIPPKSNIDTLVKEEIKKRARRMALDALREQQKEASRVGVLRT